MPETTGGGFNNVLIVGADSLSRYVDWTDRGTCILFGDAAGAVVMQVISVLDCMRNIHASGIEILYYRFIKFRQCHCHHCTIF